MKDEILLAQELATGRIARHPSWLPTPGGWRIIQKGEKARPFGLPFNKDAYNFDGSLANWALTLLYTPGTKGR